MKVGTAFGARFLILIPMAYCIFLLLDSQDKSIRLLALIGLIVLEQIREWVLISSMRELSKDNKASGK